MAAPIAHMYAAYQQQKNCISGQFLAGSVFPDIRLLEPSLSSYHQVVGDPTNDFEAGIRNHIKLDELRLKKLWATCGDADYRQAHKVFEDEVLRDQFEGLETCVKAVLTIQNYPPQINRQVLRKWVNLLEQYLQEHDLEAFIGAFTDESAVTKRLELIGQFRQDPDLRTEVLEFYQSLGSKPVRSRRPYDER